MADRTIKTRHGEITFEELAEIQPGMARLMDELSRRWAYSYFAAKGGNWDLARHELKQVVGLLNIAAKLRPRYTDDIKEFISTQITPLNDATEKRNWKSFDESVSRAIDASNKYHEKYGFGFIRYILPRSPPEHLDLGPSQH